MSDQPVQFGQIIEWHSGVHVVLDVIIHLPIKICQDRIEQHGTRIDAVIVDFVGQADMLRHVEQVLKSAAIKWRQRDQNSQHRPARHDRNKHNQPVPDDEQPRPVEERPPAVGVFRREERPLPVVFDDAEAEQNHVLHAQEEAARIDEGEAEMDTAYIAYKGFSFGKAMVGRFKAPFGLEELTSSKWISTIERSPTPELGFLAGKPSFQFALHGHSKPMFWQAALIDEDKEDDDGSDAYSIAARVGGHFALGEDSFMHLAGSFASRDFGDDHKQRFRTRLGVHTIGSRPIDVKDIVVDDADQYGLEAAAVFGPLSLQGEYRSADFDAGDGAGASDVDVDGYYLQASYLVTGETRGYKGKSGKFDKVKPKGKHGAIELIAKYEDGELDIKTRDDEIEYDLLTVGMNWYATKNVKFMLNYLDADTDNANTLASGDEEDGQAVSFRAQYVF